MRRRLNHKALPKGASPILGVGTIAAALLALSATAGAEAQTYGREDLCDPSFALERLARSDMKTLVTIMDELAGSGELPDLSSVLHRVYDEWSLQRHYLSARTAAVERSAGLTPEDVDSATTSVLRYVCENMPGSF